MQNILVTGGAGFIGSNFVRFVLKNKLAKKIINLDKLTYAGNEANLINLPDPNKHQLIQGDICDTELVHSLLTSHNIDTIVHFAAETHVDRSISGPAPFIQTNIVGTFTLLEAIRTIKNNHNIHFHHVSTDEVYGSLSITDPAFSETTPYTPNSPYSAAKASSDHLVRAYHHTYQLPITITNCSNNYGPYQFPEKLIPLMIINAAQGKPLPVYGDGKQIRDWLHVEDHCRAICEVILHGKNGSTYNVGGDNQPTNIEIINTICNILDELLPNSPYKPHNTLITYVKDRPGHDRRYAMDIRKINQELSWKPQHSLETGLRDTIKWYLDHPEWVGEILKNQDFQLWLDKNYTQRGV